MGIGVRAKNMKGEEAVGGEGEEVDDDREEEREGKEDEKEEEGEEWVLKDERQRSVDHLV